MIFFDTETTGLIKNAALKLHLQPHIIEIGAIKSNGDQFHTLVNPGIKLEPIITKITGLLDKDLRKSKKFLDVLPDLYNFFLGEDTWVAHNMPFDSQMLEFELRREGYEYRFCWPINKIDTIDMAKPHYGGKFMKLQALYEDLIGPYEQKHRALDDAIDLMAIYEKLIEWK